MPILLNAKNTMKLSKEKFLLEWEKKWTQISMIKMVSQANGENMDCSIANAGATQRPIGRKKK